ncbi:MAG: hypothetical protein ACRDJ5_01280, partial [Actinomycetota bacterium]
MAIESEGRTPNDASTSAARRSALESASRPLYGFMEQDGRAQALLESVGDLPDRTGYLAAMDDAVDSGGMRELRVEKRRRLLEIAARDLTGELPLEEATARLADLADACLQVTLRAVDAPPQLSVIGMGKLGARELNY